MAAAQALPYDLQRSVDKAPWILGRAMPQWPHDQT